MRRGTEEYERAMENQQYLRRVAEIADEIDNLATELPSVRNADPDRVIQALRRELARRGYDMSHNYKIRGGTL